MAEIKFPCPGCKVTLKVSDTLAGKKIKCPKCGAVAPIPTASTVAPPPAVVAERPFAPHPPAPPERPFVPMAQPVAPVHHPSVPLDPPVELFHPDDRVRMATPHAAPATRKKPKKTGVFVPVLAGLLVAANVAGAVAVYLGLLLPVPAALPTPDTSGTTTIDPDKFPQVQPIGPPRNPGGERKPREDDPPKKPVPPEKVETPEKLSPEVLDALTKFADVQTDDEGLRLAVHVDAGDRDLVQLAILPKQTKRFVLDLSKMKELSDPSLGDIRGRTDLTELDLSGAKGVFDSGLAHLFQMKKLQVLNLTGAEKITDGGLNYLKDLTGLKKVMLTGTKVTDDGVEKFKKALPNVEVVRE